METVKVKLLTPQFQMQVEHVIHLMILELKQAKVDQLHGYRKLYESELRLIWCGQREMSEVSGTYPPHILSPEFFECELVLSPYLTDEGYPMVCLKGGEPISIYSLPIFDTDLTFKPRLDLSVLDLSNIEMSESEFIAITGEQPQEELQNEDFIVDTTVDFIDDSVLIDDEDFYHEEEN